MSVKSSRTDKMLTLELDNGDYREFDNVIKKWNFIDEEAFIRFAISMFGLNESLYFQIVMKGKDEPIKPAPHLINKIDSE